MQEAYHPPCSKYMPVGGTPHPCLRPYLDGLTWDGGTACLDLGWGNHHPSPIGKEGGTLIKLYLGTSPKCDRQTPVKTVPHTFLGNAGGKNPNVYFGWAQSHLYLIDIYLAGRTSREILPSLVYEWNCGWYLLHMYVI